MKNRTVPLRYTGEILNPLHLRTLVVVVEAGSFADAARRLGYTSSAVSQQISALERTLKLSLFERSPHSVHPTPIAALLAERAREQLSGLRQLEDEIALMADGQLGKLRMGSFPTASKRLLPKVLAKLHGDFPELELLLDEGEPGQLINSMRDAELDIALVYHYDLVPATWPRSLRRRPLFAEDISLIFPADHHLAAVETIEILDLIDEPWISTRADTAGAVCISRVCAQHGFEPRIVMRSNDYDVVSGLVQAGLGIAALPALSQTRFSGVVKRTVSNLNVRRYSSVLYRPVQYNPVIRTALASIDLAVAKVMADADGVVLASDSGLTASGASGR